MYYIVSNKQTMLHSLPHSYLKSELVKSEELIIVPGSQSAPSGVENL